MKLVHNFDLFREYYDIDAKRFCSFKTLRKSIGKYKMIEGKMTGLLVEDNALYFLYGETRFLVTGACKVLLNKISKTAGEVSFVNTGEVVVSFLYEFVGGELNVAPFEYIDEEDFDWGLFLANVINDPERKKTFITNLMERY